MTVSEFDLSGQSRYAVGPEYTKLLLNDLSIAQDPSALKAVAQQAQNLAEGGIISEGVSSAISHFLQVSKNKKIPL